MSIFFLILLFLLLLPVLLFFLVIGLLSKVFGTKFAMKNFGKHQVRDEEAPSAPTRRKIFDKDEGEYVEFEEMKEK